MTNTKERLLAAINTVTPLDDYIESDCIFSQKYPFNAATMVYVLLRLSSDFQFNWNIRRLKGQGGWAQVQPLAPTYFTHLSRRVLC